MKLSELITASRSYRSFDRAVAIRLDQLLSWVNAARLSPSSRNLQALKFRIVESEEECASVFPLTRWAGLITDRRIPPVGHEPVAYIVICLDSSLTDQVMPFQRDVGICAQSIMLSATADGFGGCMIGSFSSGQLQEALKLPSHLSPQLVLALGKPDETVELVDAQDGNIAYYRKDNTHVVPKRSLEDLII